MTCPKCLKQINTVLVTQKHECQAELRDNVAVRQLAGSDKYDRVVMCPECGTDLSDDVAF
jgi:hypothetical protein